MKFTARAQGDIQVVKILSLRLHYPSALFLETLWAASMLLEAIQLEGEISQHATGHYVEKNSVLPHSELFESSVNVFVRHIFFIPRKARVFNLCSTHYSTIPSFQYSPPPVACLSSGGGCPAGVGAGNRGVSPLSSAPGL